MKQSNYRSKPVVRVFGWMLILLVIAVLLANQYVNDGSVPNIEIAKSGDRVLAVFAHPDDEIMVAGTFALLAAQGIETGLIYLTQGEAGPTGGLVPQSGWGQTRVAELKVIEKILEVDYLRIFNFPDSGVHTVPADEIKQRLEEAIKEFRPTTVIGFDTTVGLYGHEDHRLAGLYLKQVLEETKPQSVDNYYQVTLPEPLIELALKMSKMFRERYGQTPTQILPPANASVAIWRAAPKKKKVLLAHKTQWQVINDVQPYGTVLPAYLYYGVFSREYFHAVTVDE